MEEVLPSGIARFMLLCGGESEAQPSDRRLLCDACCRSGVEPCTGRHLDHKSYREKMQHKIGAEYDLYLSSGSKLAFP